jgi:O-antigen ligase
MEASSVLQPQRLPQRLLSRRGSPDSRGLARWYYLASGFFLLQTIGAFGVVSRLYYGDWQGGFTETTKLAVILNVLTMVVSPVLFWRGVRKTGSISAGGILAILLAVFLLVSVAWSIDPSTTLRRGLLYVFFVLGVIGVATNLKSDEFIDLVSTICFLSAIASLVLLAVFPSYAIMGDSGSLGEPMRGIFAHKNVLGQVMAVGALASIHRVRASRKGRLRSVAKLVVFLVMAFASKSSTSLLTIVYLYCLSGIIMLVRGGGAARILGVSLTVLLIPISVTVALFSDFFLEMIGKDPTLTGRTVLWEIVINEIYERLMLGWGFFAFWGPANPIASAISASLGWGVAHAHNGLLEMLLELGIIGAAFIIVIFVRNVALACRCLRTSASELGTSTLLCCGAIVFTGTTEAVLLDNTEVWTSMFFILGLMCERIVRAVRSSQYLTVSRAVPRVSGAIQAGRF